MISSIKKMEKKLQDTEEKYRFIIENTNDLISLLNGKFEFESVNEQAFLKLLGYPREELIENRILDIIHPDDCELTVNTFLKGFEKGKGSIEHRIRHKDGGYIWVEARGRKLVDSDGKQKILIISKDITEHKLNKLKLKESEVKYRHLFEESKHSIIP